jgi:hypothetical protein
MKITVPGFVTEEHVQTAMKRLATKGVSPEAPVLMGAAIGIGIAEFLRSDAGIAAGIAAATPPDIAAGDLGLSTLLPGLPQEDLKFLEADLASRGVDASEVGKWTPLMMKLFSQPKKEISVILPEES